MKTQKIINFLKQETVLSIAMLLAIISMFFVTPDEQYIDYIDFRTLGILFCLMSVMEGLKGIGVFEWLAQKLISKVGNMWQLVIILTMLCFFSSMLITNDVALITFVPLTIIIINILGNESKQKYMIPIVVMQTVAANLGSMLTPIGNPQNLYLYGQAEMDIMEFIVLMLPYTATAFVILIVWSIKVCDGINTNPISIHIDKVNIDRQKNLVIYIILFMLCLLTVARILLFEILLIVVIFVFLLVDRKALLGVDYGLLLTFIAFFIFIGNMGRVDGFRMFLENIIDGNEMITAAVSSQVISNVPAALLLSGFTDNYRALIIGTNIGGLGTLIASMASLISFKYVVKEDGSVKGKYMFNFTLVNIFILIIMLVFALGIK